MLHLLQNGEELYFFTSLEEYDAHVQLTTVTMIALIQIDWKSVFVPSLHLGEVILRGSIVYLFLFLVLRFVRRGVGAIGISDLLVVVLIADAAQNALGSE